MKKQITEKQLLDKIEEYKKQIFENKNISATKFHGIQIGLMAAKYIINDAFGTPRKIEHAWVK